MANEFARALRRDQTDEEYLLWLELRELRNEGCQFRRQAPLEGFIVDFVCYRARPVIEVDGSQHEEPEGLRKDAARDAHLRWQGFDVLRFSNGDVRSKLDGVMMEIQAKLGLIPPLPEIETPGQDNG